MAVGWLREGTGAGAWAGGGEPGRDESEATPHRYLRPYNIIYNILSIYYRERYNFNTGRVGCGGWAGSPLWRALKNINTLSRL